MELADFLYVENALTTLKPRSKRQLLQDLAAYAAGKINGSERDIFDRLLQREHLGSTGVGNGIAIPHSKLPDLPGIIGVFARLEQPIDYDAMDDQPVDLVCLLLAPEGSGADHLKALSRVARALRDPYRLDRLRAAEDAEQVHHALVSQSTANAA